MKSPISSYTHYSIEDYIVYKLRMRNGSHFDILNWLRELFIYNVQNSELSMMYM